VPLYDDLIVNRSRRRVRPGPIRDRTTGSNGERAPAIDIKAKE
jgi:hypothetical protein